MKNHTEHRGHREKQRLSGSWYEKVDNEQVQTQYELTLPEFVSVRFSSLFFKFFSIFLLCSFMNQRFIADSVVDYPLIIG